MQAPPFDYAQGHACKEAQIKKHHLVPAGKPHASFLCLL